MPRRARLSRLTTLLRLLTVPLRVRLFVMSAEKELQPRRDPLPPLAVYLLTDGSPVPRERMGTPGRRWPPLPLSNNPSAL